MKHITLVVPEVCDETVLLQVMERFARRQPLQVRLCSQEPQLSDGQLHLLGQLEAIGAATSSQLSVTTNGLLALKPDLVIVLCGTADAGGLWARQDLARDLSRRSPRPVWIMDRHTGPPSSVTALVGPDKEGDFDPLLAAEVLRLSFNLARTLNVPMDIINVWYFLEEGLLRSWRIRMPEQEIAERKRRAAWIAQSAFARLSATLPPDLAWRRIEHVRGPIGDALRADLLADTLVVTGSEGRDGWAARLHPNLAEDLCPLRKTGIVIAKHCADLSTASHDHRMENAGMDEDTCRASTEGSHQKKSSGS